MWGLFSCTTVPKILSKILWRSQNFTWELLKFYLKFTQNFQKIFFPFVEFPRISVKISNLCEVYFPAPPFPKFYQKFSQGLKILLENSLNFIYSSPKFTKKFSFFLQNFQEFLFKFQTYEKSSSTPFISENFIKNVVSISKFYIRIA